MHDEAQPGLTSMQGTDAAPAPVACMHPHTGAAAVAASMAAGAADAAQAVEPISMTRDTATSASPVALPLVHISAASSSHAGATSVSNTPEHEHTARTAVRISEHSSPAVPARHSGQSAVLVPRMTRGDSDVLLDDIMGATFSSPEPSQPGSTGSAERRAKAELARKRCWPDPHSPSKRRRLDMPRVDLARVQQQEAYVYDTMRMLDAAFTMEHWTAAQNIARAREAHIAQVEAECAHAERLWWRAGKAVTGCMDKPSCSGARRRPSESSCWARLASAHDNWIPWSVLVSMGMDGSKGCANAQCRLAGWPAEAL